MKSYQYDCPLEGIRTLTEQQVLDEYYDHWCNLMRKVGKEDLISKELCVEDWCTVHYAWELENV